MDAGCELPNLTDGFSGEAPDLAPTNLVSRYQFTGHVPEMNPVGSA